VLGVVAGFLFLTRPGADFPVFYPITLLPVLVLLLCRWATS
jgi:hypothetical protein